MATLRRAVPDIGTDMALLVLTVGRIESHWGDGWGNAERFEQPQARESNNWGAITASPSWQGASFGGRDSKWTPSGVEEYRTRFRAYPSREAAAKDLWQVLGAQYTGAVDAALSGRWGDVSEALYGYYRGTQPREQAIATHRGRFLAALGEIRQALGLAPLPSLPAPGAMPSSGEGLGKGLGLLLLAWALSGKKGQLL
jgi:hypothetical protein